MRCKNLLKMLFLSLLLASPALAQDIEKTTALKLQLIELQAQEEDLRLRLQMLDEQLKPENIERSLAGVGSTRPEELREQRQRQLMIEKNSALGRLKTIETRRSNLEAQIATAETAAYHQSAYPSPSPTGQALTAAQVTRMPWGLLLICGAVALLLIPATIILIRRRAS